MFERGRSVYGQLGLDGLAKKYLLIVDEVNIFNRRTLYAVNKQLYRLRGYEEDFGDILIVLFYGDFR